MSERPLIGLYTGFRKPLEAVVPLRLRALAAESMLQDVSFMVFSSEDVDLDGSMVNGLVLESGDWTERLFPLPDAVMNPTYPRTDLDRAVEEALRRHAPFTTTRIADKVGVSELLGGTPLAEHVIPFAPLEPQALVTQIADFVARHGRVVAKPSKGQRGQNVMFLSAAEGGVQVRWHAQEAVMPVEEVAERLRPLVAEGPWLLQRFVLSRARGDRYFDVRIHVHKDGSGAWALVRAYVRLSEAGLMVSNTSRGGYQGDINHFFASLRKDAPAMVERLCRLGLDTAATIDGHYGGALDELGVDLLVDGSRQPWVAEVNTHPQSRYHEFERARLAIAYARHLAIAARTFGTSDTRQRGA